MILCNAHAVP